MKSEGIAFKISYNFTRIGRSIDFLQNLIFFFSFSGLCLDCRKAKPHLMHIFEGFATDILFRLRVCSFGRHFI